MQGTKTDVGVLFEADGQEPINASLDDNDNPRYQTDDFRMLYMKVLPCCKRFVHDWSDCPFSHPGEKARRRDPKSHNYTGIACPDMKKTGMCIRADNCPYAHNVFEYWLHPTRYRSQLCNDGPKCRRRVCFFAHTIDQLRVPPSKPFVSPETLTDGKSEVANMQMVLNLPIPGPGSMSAHADLPSIHSPVAATEPPVRNMSMSTASTSGSVELPARLPTDADVAHSSSTFAGAQTVSFAPPEGYKEAEQQGRSGPDEPGRSRSGTLQETALQEVAASLSSVKMAIKSGVADRSQVIDMLTSLLRETLQDMPGASTLDAAMKLAAAASSSVSASSTLPASSQPQRPPDPFTAVADRSFDAPWPAEDATTTDAAGQATSEAALTAALSAALSGAQKPIEAGGMSPMPSGEALLGAQSCTMARQSFAPEALLSARAAASASHLSRPTTTDGAALPQPQHSRGLEAPRPPSGRVGSTVTSQQQHHYQAAAAQPQVQQQQQQQLVQQLHLRRATLLSQYRNRSMHQLATAGSGEICNMTSALEEYSRTGDLRALQRLSAVMGPPAGAMRSLSAEQGFAGPAAAVQGNASSFLAASQQQQQLPGSYEGQLGQQQPMDIFEQSSGGLTARDLLYPDSFANAFAQVAGSGGGMANLNNAAFLQAMEFNAPRAGSAPAYLNTSQDADAYSQAYSTYLGQDPQMFGSAYSDRPNT